MNTKIRNKKSKCNKNNVLEVVPQKVEGIDVHVPAKVVASVVCCSVAYVKKSRRKDYEGTDTELQQRIQVGEQLLQDGIKKVVEEAHRTLNK